MSNRDHILITPARGISDPLELDDPTSIASQLARARGEGRLAKATPRETASGETALIIEEIEQDLDEDEQAVLVFDQGQVKTESGLVMRFVDEKYHGLSYADIISIPSLKSYPVPIEAKESLPTYVTNRAKEQGHVKLTAEYDNETPEFRDIEIGWVHDVEDPVGEMMELLSKVDSDVPVIDFIAYMHGPPEWRDEEAIAEARDIDTETVERNIRKLQRELESKEKNNKR